MPMPMPMPMSLPYYANKAIAFSRVNCLDALPTSCGAVRPPANPGKTDQRDGRLTSLKKASERASGQSASRPQIFFRPTNPKQASAEVGTWRLGNRVASTRGS